MSSKNYPTGINHWPEQDRPREKLARYGEGRLTDSELLAILLRTGFKGQSALDLGRTILDKFGSFRNMSHMDIRQWQSVKGLGPAKIAQVKAALEIGRRFREQSMCLEKKAVRSSADIARMMLPRLRDLKIEVFQVVYLNAQNHVLQVHEAARGTVHFAAPIIREILHHGLQIYAVGMICVHNHPSGGILPSSEDRRFTRSLQDGAKLLQVKLVDHLIVGDNAVFSFADEGLLV